MGKKIIRSATIGLSLNVFCKGLIRELVDEGYDVVALSTPDNDLSELAEREGVRTIGVDMERHISPLKDLRSLFKLYEVFKQEKPDMVHSMTPKAGLLCMIAAWMARVPVRLHTFTGLVWPTAKGLSRIILMTTDRILCFCATHIIPEGEGVKADLQRCITQKPMKVLGYGNVKGVDLDYWKRSDNESSFDDVNAERDSACLTFLFVGRIVRDKGMNELVSAFVRLNKKYQSSKLVLVGPYEDSLDPVNPETRKAIDESPFIEAVGAQKDVRAFYEKADVLVFPSYREGFPNAVIEAGAMGLASIVTDINGSREIISDRENGLIIQSKDEDALYDAMVWMIEHPDERERMARKARPMVAARFEQGFVRKCLKDYYREILG